MSNSQPGSFDLFVFPLKFDIGHVTEHWQWLLSLKQKTMKNNILVISSGQS